jgi:hypothetical protein
LWFDRLGLSLDDKTALLNELSSKLKMEELVRGDAIMAGDVLQAEVKVKRAAGSSEVMTVTKTAEVND